MLSNTSRFARLAERASYFSLPHPPSLVLHLHEAKLFLPRSLHLPNVSIIPFSLHVKDQSKSLPHPSLPHPEISSALSGFLCHAASKYVRRDATRQFRSEQIPVRELDGSSIDWNVSLLTCVIDVLWS